jgi:hypothetical protein
LPAGSYAFRIELRTGGDIGQTGDYAGSLAISGGSVPAVPLPPTALAAGVTGAGAVLFGRLYRRRHASRLFAVT